jgi:hypothetical protein
VSFDSESKISSLELPDVSAVNTPLKIHPSLLSQGFSPKEVSIPIIETPQNISTVILDPNKTPSQQTIPSQPQLPTHTSPGCLETYENSVSSKNMLDVYTSAPSLFGGEEQDKDLVENPHINIMGETPFERSPTVLKNKKNSFFLNNTPPEKTINDSPPSIVLNIKPPIQNDQFLERNNPPKRRNNPILNITSVPNETQPENREQIFEQSQKTDEYSSSPKKSLAANDLNEKNFVRPISPVSINSVFPNLYDPLSRRSSSPKEQIEFIPSTSKAQKKTQLSTHGDTNSGMFKDGEMGNEKPPEVLPSVDEDMISKINNMRRSQHRSTDNINLKHTWKKKNSRSAVCVSFIFLCI